MKIDELLKRQNLIIAILILFFGFIIARNTYENLNKKIASLKEQIRDRQEREEILRKIQILEKRIEEYKEKFPKRDTSLLIEELTRNAGICNIKVSSISPEQEIVYENFIEQRLISMDLLSSYHNFGRFLAILERNPQIKIQEIRLSKIEGEKEPEDLRTNISISLISFK